MASATTTTFASTLVSCTASNDVERYKGGQLAALFFIPYKREGRATGALARHSLRERMVACESGTIRKRLDFPFMMIVLWRFLFNHRVIPNSSAVGERERDLTMRLGQQEREGEHIWCRRSHLSEQRHWRSEGVVRSSSVRVSRTIRDDTGKVAEVTSRVKAISDC